MRILSISNICVTEEECKAIISLHGNQSFYTQANKHAQTGSHAPLEISDTQGFGALLKGTC